MKRAVVFYPFVLALYPVARLYGDNASLLMGRYVILPAVLCLLGAIVAYGIFRLTYRDATRAAVATTVVVVLFFTYGLAHRGFENFSLSHGGHLIGLTRHRVLLPLWGLFTALGLWAASRASREASPKLPNFAATVLLGLALIQGLRAGTPTLEKGAAMPLSASSSRPDIYYIILDGYGRADVLRRFYGYDNGPFLRELRARGFWIGEKSHSNYLETGYSLPSSLNSDFFPALTHTEGGESTEKALADARVLLRLVDANRTAQTLRGAGYRIVNMGSGFSLTNYSRSADANVGSSIKLGEFDAMLLSTTALLPAMPPETQMLDGDDLNAELRRLSEVPVLASPKFVFAHILSPHPPYQFDAQGRPAPRPPTDILMNWEDFRGYIGQMRYLNAQVLHALDAILAGSKERPIIVIQGDHGPSLKDERVDRHWNQEWTPDLFFARSRILNALLVPDDVRRALYPAITPVNTFRTILRAHFSARLPNLPDATFFSTAERPLLFRPVPQATLREP